jgi:hypothetical protein
MGENSEPLAGKSQRKRPQEGHKYLQEDNIKINTGGKNSKVRNRFK